MSSIVVGMALLGSEAAVADPVRFVAFGDSITAGFNARRPLVNRDFSWAAGWRTAGGLQSHRLRLEEQLGERNVTTVNASISGAVSHDLAGQLSRQGKARIDYATVIIGANDMCDGMPLTDAAVGAFGNRVGGLLAALVARNPQVRITLGAIPDLVHLYEISRGPACERRWELTKFCTALLGRATPPAKVEHMRALLVLANDELARQAERFPDNVRFVARLGQPEFTDEHVSSYDCFHPNVAGQAFISEVMWDEGWRGMD